MRWRDWHARPAAGMLLALSATLFLFFPPVNCRPATPASSGAPSSAPVAEEPDAPKGEAIADPVLREARARADVIVTGLLAGKLEQGQQVWPLEKKLKGFQSSSIKTQRLVREGTAQFKGVPSGSTARTSFSLKLVKQASGRWEIGWFSFSGPVVSKVMVQNSQEGTSAK